MRFGPGLLSAATTRTAFAVRAAFAVLVAPVLAACGDEASPPWGSQATGSIQGGESLAAPTVDCKQTGTACSTWTYLYACYFGPTASGHGGGCSAQTACHVNAASPGTSASGFVCGSTKNDCWQGMTLGENPNLPTLVHTNKAPSQYLYGVLYQDGTDGGVSSNNMPTSSAVLLSAPPVMPGFTKAEMACIKGWVAAGAQND
jgi:hypothetical protein